MRENNINKVFENMELMYPMEIEHPQQGFNGYLLRCKAIPEEECSNSIIIYEPDNKNAINSPLPSSLDDRLKIRQQWWHKTTKGNYACFNYDLKEDAMFEEIVRAFPKDPLVIQEIVDEVIAQCKSYLPSYEVFAVVAHINQLSKRVDDSIGIRPPHFHILMKAYKRRTPEEIKLLNN